MESSILELFEKVKRLSELREKMEELKGVIERWHEHERCTAIIVEPRRHRALGFVVKNVLENLNSNWTVRIYHGNGNHAFVEALLAGELSQCISRISLENLGDQIVTSQNYSHLLCSREFTAGIPTETFLVFQTDSMINPRYRDLLHTFMKYEYVGAPWVHGGVGNGGFSLRKRSKMLAIIDSVPPHKTDYEDTFFCNGTETVQVFKPPAELAALFSMETVYTAVSFGIHMAWKYHPEKLEEMCKNCPGLETLIELQGVSTV